MEPDALEEQRIEPREFRVKADKALVYQRTWARGAGSGIQLELDNWAVWTLDDEWPRDAGGVLFMHEESEALEAAGLKE